MAMRIDETISGVKADLAVKVFGDDFRTLDAIGQQVVRVSLLRSRRGRSADGDHFRRRRIVDPARPAAPWPDTA